MLDEVKDFNLEQVKVFEAGALYMIANLGLLLILSLPETCIDGVLHDTYALKRLGC